MTNKHPTSQQLEAHCLGTLPPAVALLISAHIDMCPHCQRQQAQMLQALGQQQLSEVSNGDFGSMLADIFSLPAAATSLRPAEQSQIELDGRRFPLPATLGRYARKVGNWSHLLGKLWQAPVDLGGEHKAHFIYMEKGGKVPEHTHRGNEFTLVLQGHFSDGLSDYHSGDFVLMSNEHQHSPYSEADDGCLVFSVVDQPLHFTSGLARLLNPFSQLFFK